MSLQNRSLTPPVSGSTDFSETFGSDQVVKALFKTIAGKTFFDGVNQERLITHELRIEYVAGVTAQTWVLYAGRRFDILSVENCCENDEVLILTCNERGTATAAHI